MEVIWSVLTKKDLRNIYNHSSGVWKEETVKCYILKLIAYTDFLSQNPFLGKFIFNHNNLEYRMLIYRKHKIIYTITENINIVSVIHSSRNVDEILNQIKSL